MRLKSWAGVFAVVAAVLCADARAGTSSSMLDVSTDGKWLAAVNADNNSISIVSLSDSKLAFEVPVGNRPENVTFLGDRNQLAVTVYRADQVVFVDATTGKVTARVDVFDEPYGIVSTPDGARVYVTLEYPGQIVEISTDKHEVVRTIDAGKFLRGLALSADGETLYATEYLTCNVVGVSTRDGAVSGHWPAVSSDNLARQIVVHPTRPKAYIAHVRSRTQVNQGEGSIVPILSVLNLGPGEGPRRSRIALDSFYSIFVVANPWEVDISRDGKNLVIVFAGTNDLFLCDVIDDDYRELAFRRVAGAGKNPRAIRFSPDGSQFYILNSLDFNVSVHDARTGRRVETIEVCKNVMPEDVLEGKILFYSALEPMVGRRWISCSSCHPDGDADGRTWQNPEGLRNTTALYGMAWTHPLHWSADRDETQDFEHTIRGRLMQGRGLVGGTIPGALDAPLKGMSKTLDALAAYSNHHGVPLSPHAKNGLTESAQRGQKLFSSTATGCAECHSGLFFTDSTPVKPYKLHDVGTGDADKTEKMGPNYDTPTLLGVYRTAPYLHHGTAATLKDVLTTENHGDRHGKTSQLSPAEIDDLVEFLKSLPFEDPETKAREIGLKPVLN